MRLKHYLMMIIMMFALLLICQVQVSLAADLNLDAKISMTKNYAAENYDFKVTGMLSDQGMDLKELFLTYPDFALDRIRGKLTIGRMSLKSGPGHFSQLMLSDQGPSLNLIKLDSQNQYFKFSQLVAFLGEGVNKQLFIHRLSTTDQFIKGLELGAAEAMMVSEKIHPAYYIPFVPYYLTKTLIGSNSVYDRYGDNYVGFDFTYTFKNRAKLYGEILIDEHAVKDQYGNPDKRAHLIGGYYPLNQKTEIRAEYSNVFNYVYQHRFPQNNYADHGQLIGHWLGPDGDVFDLEVHRELNPSQAIRFGLRYLRKGTGNLDQDYYQSDQDKIFLETITRRELLIRTGYEYQLNEKLKMDLKTDIGRAIKSDQTENVFNLGLELNVEI